MSKKSIYTIESRDNEYFLQLYSSEGFLIIESQPFKSFKLCQKYLDTLRVHLCFQTNFSRTKNLTGQYGFDIRTCWDDKVASSGWYADRAEREKAMNLAFDSNKKAVFMHSNKYKNTYELDLQEVA